MKKYQPTSTPCERSSLFSRLLSSWALLFSLVQSRISSHLIAPVRRVILATQLARTTNLRNYAAAFLIAGLAPFSQVAYRLFNERSGDPSNYWNAFYFLKAVGPHLALLLCLVGAFISFPKSNKFKFVFIVPAAYAIGRIIWLSLIKDNAGFHAFTPISILIIGAAIAAISFTVFDYLMHTHFHRKKAFDARLRVIRGLVKGQNIRREESLPLYETVIDEMESFSKIV